MKNILRSVAVSALLVMASTSMVAANEYQAKLEALAKDKLNGIHSRASQQANESTGAM